MKKKLPQKSRGVERIRHSKGDEEKAAGERVAEEERIREKVDGEGNRWRKVYFGSGAHFRNWLDQCLELWGEGKVEVEEVDSTGFQCFEESGEKMYRIWVREDNLR